MLRLYYHPFAQYCQKVLIALYEHDLPFQRAEVNLGDPGQRAALAALWPFTRFPVLETGDAMVLGESGIIIEYLDMRASGRMPLVPGDRAAALEPRMLERVTEGTAMLSPYPNLAGYVARGTARPAFARAFDAQLAGFTGSPPPEFAAWLEKQKQREAQEA